MTPRVALTLPALAASLLLTTTAQATELDYLSNNASSTGGWWSTAQTFTVDSAQTLLSYSFMGGAAPQNAYRFSIYDWTAGGAALYTATPTWVYGQNDIEGIDLRLQAGHTYAAEVDTVTFTSFGVQFGGDVYAGGSGYWSQDQAPNGNPAAFQNFSNLDTAFRAELASAVPEPASIGLLLAGVCLLVVAGRHRVRRDA